MATENVSRIASDFETQLSGAISAGDSSFTLQSVIDLDGDTLSDGIYCFTIDRDNTDAKEYLIGQLTAATKTVASISSISRQGVATANAQRSHRIGANVIISDHSILAAIARIFTGQGTINPAAPLEYSSAPTLSSATQLATKGYVDSVVNGGTVNSDRIIFGSQTAGETISEGDIIYFKSSDQRWYKADADVLATFQNVQLGVAQGSGTSGNPITDGVLIYGKADNFSGLTPGSIYYLSNTAGGMSTSVGTSAVKLGQAEDADTFFFNPDTATGAAISATTGASDAGKLIKTNSNGLLDQSLSEEVVVRSYTTPATFLGDSTTRYDITNPSGTTFRYTYDATGTNPNITSSNPSVGSYVNISAQNFSAGNNGRFQVTGSGTNYFEVTNASGVVESDKTIGTGFIAIGVAWTKPANLKYIEVEVQAGGAGGGGADSSPNSARGGGAGGYAKKKISAASLSATEVIVVGSAGNGGAGTGAVADNGGAGKPSHFGSLISATGGLGDGTPGTGVSGDINISGQAGQGSLGVTGTNWGGSGGDSFYGKGGYGSRIGDSQAGANAGGSAYGYGGGGGGASRGSSGDAAGGNGSQGIVIVTEHYI